MRADTAILFKDAPFSAELDFHMGNDSWWEKATPEEAIEEVKEILSTYYEKGHSNYEGLHEYDELKDYPGIPSSYIKEAKRTQKGRKEEVKELKQVIEYLTKERRTK